VGKTHPVERVGTQVSPRGFVKLDFRADLATLSALFDGPTDNVDAIVSRIARHKCVHLDRETAFIVFDEVQLYERALNSLRFFEARLWILDQMVGAQGRIDARGEIPEDWRATWHRAGKARRKTRHSPIKTQKPGPENAPAYPAPTSVPPRGWLYVKYTTHFATLNLVFEKLRYP